jgi:DNA-binding NarL/FixJ family response regulator
VCAAASVRGGQLARSSHFSSIRPNVLGSTTARTQNGPMTELCRVLLADDVPEIRKLLRLTLELDGRFEVIGEAGDGAEAVRIVSSERPDVVILDLSMPVMDGFEAIPVICRSSPETKILVLSAFDVSTSTTVLSLGADAYMVKGTGIHEDVVPTLISLCN